METEKIKAGNNGNDKMAENSRGSGPNSNGPDRSSENGRPQTQHPREKETVFTFKRLEKKYMLSSDRYEAFMREAGEHLIPDEYHKSLVCSLYYDTENYALIRHSLDKPVYKEKLRVRSYGVPAEDGTAFVELKKKYKGIVYKRRVQMTPLQAERWLSGEAPAPMDTQITREIDWFLKMNPVSPKMLIACDRTSWKDRDNPELRFTFDSGIRCREEQLRLTEGDHGRELLEEGFCLMEIKIPGAAPIWLARLLSNEKIFPSSYSKYGTGYRNKIAETGAVGAAE